MEKRKLCLVLDLFGFGKFNMVPLGVHQFLHKGDVCGLREPALFIQQGQNTWWVVLQGE